MTRHLVSTTNHQSSLFNMSMEIENWFSNFFSSIPQSIENFLMGGFHFLITFLFSVLLIYAVFLLVFYCLPNCCKYATKTFQSKKEDWDQQVQTFHFRNRERQ